MKDCEQKTMEREEASKRFINWDDNEEIEKRKDSNLTNFARKMSSIMLGDSGDVMINHDA